MIQEKTSRHTKALLSVVLLAALLGASVLLVAEPAYAKTFTVTNTNDSGQGSLRRAVDAASARAGVDAIGFAIPGGGVKTNVQPPVPGPIGL